LNGLCDGLSCQQRPLPGGGQGRPYAPGGSPQAAPRRLIMVQESRWLAPAAGLS